MSTELAIGLSCIMVVLILLSSMFSAAETAYSSVNPAKIQEEISKKSKTGKILKKHLKSFGWTLSTILIGNNLVNIGSSVLISYLLGTTFKNPVMVTIISIAAMTPIIVIFGEILPKLFARKYAYKYLVKIVFVLEVLNWVFLPLTLPLKKLKITPNVTNTEDQIKQLLFIGKQEGVIEKREATLATNALDLDSRKVVTVQTKIKDTKFLESNQSIRVAKKIFEETGFSRIPLIHKGNWIGVIHLKDIVFKSTGQLLEFCKEVPTISKNTILTLALEKLRYNNSHIAFVSQTNKGKNIIGIITLEDIIEELVGEIYDEHDKFKKIREVGLHKWVAEGGSLMQDLQEELNIEFEDAEEDTTIYQWISKRINRHIKVGLKYTYKGKVKFKVSENKKSSETVFEITEK